MMNKIPFVESKARAQWESQRVGGSQLGTIPSFSLRQQTLPVTVATRDEERGLVACAGHTCHGSWKIESAWSRGVIFLPDKASARRKCT